MFSSLPPVTRSLIIACVVIWFAEWQFGDVLTVYLGLWPVGSGQFEPWQIVTYAFLHEQDGITHLLFNMFALYMFGRDLERLWGSQRFLNLYLASVITAALAQLAFAAAVGADPYPTIGASGGIFGILLAFAMYFPRRTILLLIPPIPMPAWLFVTLYGLIELVLGVTGTQQGVAHFAHLGGMLGAWLLVQYWRGRPPFAR
ncbi:MAG TPA: rhomboid family intramembrane serine protease [Burkholderiales bacterium]|nr:rhomboid family intramembrane serine protease [Burkholderiales bacterium]